MKLSPHEIDKLLITQAGFLAQRRYARGVRLNYPESVALIACVCLELIRDGHSVSSIMEIGRRILGHDDVMPGISSLLHEVQIEGTFADGSKLVTIHNPIVRKKGERALALYGSCIEGTGKIEGGEGEGLKEIGKEKEEAIQSESDMVIEKSNELSKTKRKQPSSSSSNDSSSSTSSALVPSSPSDHPSWFGEFTPGRIIPNPSTPILTLNAGRRLVSISVVNTDDRPIQIGSHYPFIETNARLSFDRSLAYGMRLAIPAGTAVRFEPGEKKRVTLVEYGGKKIVKGGNNLCAGPIDDEGKLVALQRIKERGFANETESSESINNALTAAGGKRARTEGTEHHTIAHDKYIQMCGPTVGDGVLLGDTGLIGEVEVDLCAEGGYGDECKFGGGKVIREGQGQGNGIADADAVDLLISNVLIIDAVAGIIKADVGIKGTRICGIGKAGNPDTMNNVHPNLLVGVTTEVIDGSGLILTAGAIDTHVHYICPQLITEALASGITTLLGGGTGPATGTLATTCTPGSSGLQFMMQSTDDLPINLAFTGKGNTACAEGLDEQAKAGAAGFKLHEDWGSTPAAIDACLAIADKYDVQVTLHTDTLNESASVEDTIAAFNGRTIHAYHTEGAGGGHAPDILRVVSFSHVIPSSTNPTRPYTVNTIDEHLDMLCVCHHLDKNLPEDVAFAESRIRAETIAAEDILHDIGAISIMSSDSQAMGRIGEVISRTWQTAAKMKQQRGILHQTQSSTSSADALPSSSSASSSTDRPSNDNFRIKRFIAKYTINPAIVSGFSDHIGSIEVGKFADLVLWQPEFFGAKPETVIKGGTICWAQMGDANASIPTPQPVIMRPMFGAMGVHSRSILFVSQAAVHENISKKYSLRKRIEAVKGCRKVKKSDMKYNDSTPNVRVDPETFQVFADGVLLSCQPAKKLPLAQKYFLY